MGLERWFEDAFQKVPAVPVDTAEGTDVEVLPVPGFLGRFCQFGLNWLMETMNK